MVANLIECENKRVLVVGLSITERSIVGKRGSPIWDGIPGVLHMPVRPKWFHKCFEIFDGGVAITERNRNPR